METYNAYGQYDNFEDLETAILNYDDSFLSTPLEINNYTDLDTDQNFVQQPEYLGNYHNEYQPYNNYGFEDYGFPDILNDITEDEIIEQLQCLEETEKSNFELDLNTQEEEVYQCESCDKQFKREVSLREHVLHTHNEDKKYLCEVCGKIFPKKYHLNDHFRSAHSKEKYECNICKKTFSLLKNLNQHTRVHSQKNGFICGICNKKYEYESNLKIHTRAHMEKPQFKCNYCGKAFRRKCNLNTHLILHSEIEGFKCEFCNEEFKLKQYLQKHIAKKHLQNV